LEGIRGRLAQGYPWENCIALIEDDQPCLADGLVNHPEEPLLLLAHPDRHLLPKAVDAVSVEYDPLPAIFSMEESEKLTEVIWGADNTFKTYLIEKGDVGPIWENGDYVVEGEYTTGAQEQLYIENNGMIASFDRQQGLTVWGSLQCPYYVHKALMKLCNLPENRVRVVQMETGGAFGGKEEYPSMIAGHAALLAMKSGRPVKIVYDRMEDMAATTKRHPSRTRHRTAIRRDGKILGGEIDFTIDGGAYETLSPVVLSRGAIHAGGPYYWPAVRIRAKAVATNTPPHGAFRGFGAPQSLFALERHMDRIAEVLASRLSRFGVEISCGLARPRRQDKPCRKKSIWKNYSIERSKFRTITQEKKDLPKTNRRAVGREWASLLFCTARDLPVRASATSDR